MEGPIVVEQMNTMEARQELIAALTNRGFKPGPLSDTGWIFNHTDHFVVWFNSQGRFRIDSPDGNTLTGVTVKPNDILDIIDQIASKL